MLILYVAMKHDYGDPRRGHSFEHWNFYDALSRMGHDILYFDFMTLLQRRGRAGMNRLLGEVARAERPALLFSVLFTDEIEKSAMSEISASGATVTVNWFCDDHWRFESFSRHWAGCFNWVVTTAQSALAAYAAIGHMNVIKSQWGCNHFVYRKLDLPQEYDVSFVGQPHGTRRAVIDALRRASLRTSVWGYGWESGRIGQEQMIEVFNRSRINLNLSNAWGPSSWPQRAASIVRRLTGRREAVTEQIKGRNFEIPGCGGFVLSGRAEDLDRYYEIETQIACFEGIDDLIRRARHYLAREDERARIAEAGHARTLSEHTYAHRFTEIFDRVGVPHPPLAAALEGSPARGATREIT